MMSYLGIDIGGSGIKGALVDVETGQLLTERRRLPTPEKAKPNDCAEVVRELVLDFEYTGVIGCGFPAVVQHGVAKTAANVHENWIGTNINLLLNEVTGCRTYALNDADAAGMAEMAFGAGCNANRGVVIVITLGTGIGTALFNDGQLVPNTEFGHMKIRDKDAETRASDAARQRKEMTWKKYGARLSEYLTEVENLFWPDLFIIGGGVSKKADEFFPMLKIRTKIVPAQLLNQAGIVGAAVYASQQA
jgi:polyphosphate glucokinase